MFLEWLVQFSFSFEFSFLFLLSSSPPLSLLFFFWWGGGCSPLSPPCLRPWMRLLIQPFLPFINFHLLFFFVCLLSNGYIMISLQLDCHTNWSMWGCCRGGDTNGPDLISPDLLGLDGTAVSVGWSTAPIWPGAPPGAKCVYCRPSPGNRQVWHPGNIQETRWSDAEWSSIIRWL